jgi:hypothetical protein
MKTLLLPPQEDEVSQSNSHTNLKELFDFNLKTAGALVIRTMIDVTCKRI